jgi:hypothetical protein
VTSDIHPSFVGALLARKAKHQNKTKQREGSSQTKAENFNITSPVETEWPFERGLSVRVCLYAFTIHSIFSSLSMVMLLP